MTNEEFDRKVGFLLNQQARFDAGMQELREAQATSERKIAKTAEAAEHAVAAVTQLTDITTKLITTTTDGFRLVFDKMNQTNEKIDVLVDSQIRTDERLRDLTVLFERHIREDHRGRKASEN